jgi:aryl-alcohol dehydrogenase (NADP+)
MLRRSIFPENIAFVENHRMEYVNLGRTGLKVSRICLGTMSYGATSWRPWILPEEEGRPFIRRALELGINFFDTADMYSLGKSEEVLGNAIRDFGSRSRVVIATKVFFPMSDDPNDRGLSRKHIFHAVDASLRRLGTDYIDLYQIHRWDRQTPIEETLEALDATVRAGKVRYIGASSMYAYQLATALRTSERNGWARFASMQNHYNLVYREEEREMIPLCRQEGLAIIPWSPLARGFLSGSRKRGMRENTPREKADPFAHELYYQESDYAIVDRVVELASRRGVPPAQISLAWLLHQPGLTAPIVGATKIGHLEDAVGALDVPLSEEERKSLEELYLPHRVLGHS